MRVLSGDSQPLAGQIYFLSSKRLFNSSFNEIRDLGSIVVVDPVGLVSYDRDLRFRHDYDNDFRLSHCFRKPSVSRLYIFLMLMIVFALLLIRWCR
jgi:hypothetical protein